MALFLPARKGPGTVTLDARPSRGPAARGAARIVCRAACVPVKDYRTVRVSEGVFVPVLPALADMPYVPVSRNVRHTLNVRHALNVRHVLECG